MKKAEMCTLAMWRQPLVCTCRIWACKQNDNNNCYYKFPERDSLEEEHAGQH